jgi:hypothetical protein
VTPTRPQNFLTVTHQSYRPEDILLSGRAAVSIDDAGNGEIAVEAVKSLRKAGVEFTPTFIYLCPIVGERVLHSQERITQQQTTISQLTLTHIVNNVRWISGNPNLDFEIYLDTNQLFYHDLFLAHKMKLR